MFHVLLALGRQRHGVDAVDAAGARRHQHDAVGQVDRFFHVMRDEGDGRPFQLVDMQDQVVHDFPRLRVERAERFVHQQHLRPAHQRAGDGDALLHAAGKLVRPGVGGGVEAHQCQQGVGAAGGGFDIGFADVFAAMRQTAAELDVLHHRQPRVQAVMLEHHGTVGARPGHRPAIGQQVAGCVVFEAADDAQQRRFAAAGSADEGDELVAGNVEIDLFQGFDAVAAFAEHLADLLYGNFRRHDLRYSHGNALRCARRNNWSMTRPIRPIRMMPTKILSVCRKRCAFRIE